ncbi:MAG: deoxyribodipyrimidine photo-lyase [Betaproteobacteria bacterium]|nr:deoxyribodipyrimidine photo-lyase [Betaproteobacteria bacterium]
MAIAIMIWSEPTLVEIDMLESALGETADRHPGNRADARLRETAHPSRMQQSLVVLRRDLRLEDHQALAQACRRSQSVYMLFVFDRDILDLLPEKLDRRVDFIWQSLRSLEQRLAELGERQSLSDSGPSNPPLLITAHAKASLAVPAVAMALGVEAVFFNHDDEPYALERDRHIAAALQALGIDCYDFKDHVVFERKEVLSQSAKAYSVFTPYKKTWLARLAADESVIESADADLTRLVSPGALQRENFA